MSTYTVIQAASLDNREQITAAIAGKLSDQQLYQTGDVEELVGMCGRAAQFVIKSVVVIVAHEVGDGKAQGLLQHLASHSWGSFDYSKVAGQMTGESAAWIIYDQIFTMARVLTGNSD